MNHFKTHIKAELHLNINGSIFQRHEFKIPVRCEESFEEWADKTAIKKAIKEGIEVPGAKVVVNYNLQIK